MEFRSPVGDPAYPAAFPALLRTAVCIALAVWFAAGCGSSQLVLLNKGMGHYSERRYEDAVSVLSEAVKTPGNLLPSAYLMRSLSYAGLGRYDLAVSDATNYIKLCPDNEDAALGYLKRGDIYIRMGKRDLAEADLKTAIGLNVRKYESTAVDLLYKIDEAEFQKDARTWRDAAVKPALPEEARKFQIQAEGAIGRKSFQEAAARYGDALRIAPWWPEGHFNRALVLGELSRHKEASLEMKRYLVLVPEAADARAAQDQIYKWEESAK